MAVIFIIGVILTATGRSGRLSQKQMGRVDVALGVFLPRYALWIIFG